MENTKLVKARFIADMCPQCQNRVLLAVRDDTAQCPLCSTIFYTVLQGEQLTLRPKRR